jgi:hypothetical protein
MGNMAVRSRRQTLPRFHIGEECLLFVDRFFFFHRSGYGSDDDDAEASPLFLAGFTFQPKGRIPLSASIYPAALGLVTLGEIHH